VFDELWDQARARAGVVDEVVADRGYDSDAIRSRLIDQDVCPQIPNHPGRARRWPLLTEAYRQRNAVERLVGRLKQFRRVATRYDKLAGTFRGFLHLALTIIRLR
jgi:transposase